MQPNHNSASIIIPLKSQKDEWLEQSVNSALQQTIQCEVLVVASSATSRSNLDLLNLLAFKNKNLHLYFDGDSLAKNINIGLHNTLTERIGLLFSDDWLELDAVEKCISYQTDIVSTGMRLYDDKDKIFKVRIPSQYKYDRLQNIEQRASYLKHFFLFRKERLLEIGGVDENIGSLGPDDYDMPWTLLEYGATVTIVQSPCYNARDHLGERLTLRKPEDMLADLNKILTKHNVSEEEKKKLIMQKQKWFGKPIHVVQREKC